MKRKSSEPTISQVAAMAGVSIATVSRVLNDPSKVRPTTVEKVSAAIDTLAYPRPQPATDLRNRLIVVVLPNLDNPFYSKIIKGIQVSAKGHGLEVLLYAEGNVDAHSRRLLDMLAMIQARGLILLSPVNRLDVLDELAGALPLVQCAEYNEESALPYVSVDDFAAARNATETLIRAWAPPHRPDQWPRSLQIRPPPLPGVRGRAAACGPHGGRRAGGERDGNGL